MSTVRELTAVDDDWKLTTLETGWGSTCVARLPQIGSNGIALCHEIELELRLTA